ncbi:MAG: vanadium-dependent haloperoxidase [bacterium]|nr:vanadium-dependent haloperoxidase [bacterium]
MRVRSRSTCFCRLVVLALVAIGVCAPVAAEPQAIRAVHGGGLQLPAPAPEHSIARIWNEELLDAIRIDTPRPTVHSRNLFHLSVVMWDAWAAYDDGATAYLFDEIGGGYADSSAARDEAISYASYRLLKHRFQVGPGAEASQTAFDDRMEALGYDANVTTQDGDSPAAVGNRIAAGMIEWGYADGANEIDDYADDSGYLPINRPLVFELPGIRMVDPNRWQPLAFDHLVLQNGIVIGTAVQDFLGPNWGQVTPFALVPENMTIPYVYNDPGMPPQLGGAGDDQLKANAVENILFSSWVDPSDGVTIDISPGGFHNNTLGTQDGTGYPLNPVTGAPYEPNVVLRADYARVLAEFWADGPDSETPPGHWNTLANYVADQPKFERRLGGKGPQLDRLEWDVKTYLVLNGALHDAAVAAWGCKGHYDYSRPISQIRYMGKMGQSSDPMGLAYHPDGLPLVPGLIEVITPASSAPGQRHAHLNEYVADIAIYAWRGNPEDPETQVGGVGWIRAVAWMPYQRDTFVTPPFAGYVSGHSTFSRAAAEVLTRMTGSAYFPGGLGTFTAHKREYLEFETGPTQTLVLTWATYFDAADEAGVSRLYGGIHPAADDFPGRIMGAEIGIDAWEKGLEYIQSAPAPLGDEGRSIEGAGEPGRRKIKRSGARRTPRGTPPPARNPEVDPPQRDSRETGGSLRAD